MNSPVFATYFPVTTLGWYSGNTSRFRPGMVAQNNPAAYNSGNRFHGPTSADAGYNGGEPGAGNTNSPSTAQYFADPDGVVRRGISAYLQPNTAVGPSVRPPVGAPSGNPMAVAGAYDSAGKYSYSTTEYQSRPLVLNRPFRTVAELGCVYSDTPWRNLDFSTPESGGAALLDVFCVNDSDNPTGWWRAGRT